MFSVSPYKAESIGSPQVVVVGPTASWAGFHFRLVNSLATSRACSTKSFATGLSVRFFTVTIPTGTRALGSSTGRTFRSGHLEGNFNVEAGEIVRKRPVAKRLIRDSAKLANTVACG